MTNLLRCLGLVVLLLSGMTVLAQDEALVTMQLGGAFTVEVPEDWQVTEPTESGYFWETADSTIRLRTYSPYVQGIFGLEIGDLPAMMEWFVTEVSETRSFDASLIETVEFGDYEGVSYTYEELIDGNRYLRTVMLYILENDFVVMGNIIPNPGAEPNEDDLAALQAAMATVEMGDTFNFYEGTTLPMPEDWQLLHDANVDFSNVIMTNEDLRFDLILWPSYGAIVGIEEPIDFLAYLFGGEFSELATFRRDNAETTRAIGFDAVWYPIDSERLNADGLYERGVLGFILPNNSGITVQITSAAQDEPLDPVFELIDLMTPGTESVCILFADPGTRIRSEPSTNAELVRQTDDERFVGTLQTTDDAGNVWYYMGEGWVRSDVVYDYNTCADVPFQR
jgi:hypothetical protein